jgi:hypothetical protein
MDTANFCGSCQISLYKYFSLGYNLLYRGDSLWQFTIGSHVHWFDHPTVSSPSTPSMPRIKQLQEVALFSFIYQAHQPFFLTLVSLVHPSVSHTYSPTHCTCFTVLSYLLLSKSVFKGVTHCIPTLVHSTPSISLSYPLLPTLPLIFQKLSIHILICSTFTDVI